MILVQRDAHDRIQAVLTYSLVHESGALHPHGKYVYVEQLEANPGFDWRGFIRQSIKKIATWYPWTVGAYWERRDKPGQPRFGFRRDRLVAYANRQEEVSVR